VFSRKDMQNSDMGKAVKDALVAGGECVQLLLLPDQVGFCM